LLVSAPSSVSNTPACTKGVIFSGLAATKGSLGSSFFSVTVILQIAQEGGILLEKFQSCQQKWGLVDCCRKRGFPPHALFFCFFEKQCKEPVKRARPFALVKKCAGHLKFLLATFSEKLLTAVNRVLEAQKRPMPVGALLVWQPWRESASLACNTRRLVRPSRIGPLFTTNKILIVSPNLWIWPGPSQGAQPR